MNSFKLAGWTMDGYRVEYTVEFDTLEDADAKIDALRKRITPHAPDTENGDMMEVHAVVRGEVNNEGRVTPRIWMYAPWGKPDNGAQLTVYLNTDEDIAAFEAASGLKVADLPLTKGKAAPAPETDTYERNARKVKMQVQREKEESKDSPVGYRWKLVRYLNAAPPAPPTVGKVSTFPPPTTVSGKPMPKDKWQEVLTRAQQWGILNPLIALSAVVEYAVEKGSDWLEGYEQAIAALAAYKSQYDVDTLATLPNVAKGSPLYNDAVKYIERFKQELAS